MKEWQKLVLGLSVAVAMVAVYVLYGAAFSDVVARAVWQ